MSLGTYKVVLLGEGRVGKTSIASRFVDDKFDSGQISTVQANMYSKKRIPVEGTLEAGKGGSQSKGRKYVDIALWDTAGQERYHALGPIYYRNANGAVLVYDITDADTFERIRMWIKELRQVVGDNIHIVICGNKSDLEKEREVNLAMAEKFAKSQGAAHYSTSAKTNEGVSEAFQCLVQKILVSAGLMGGDKDDETEEAGDDETVPLPKSKGKSASKRGGVKIDLEGDEPAPAAVEEEPVVEVKGKGKKKSGAKIADEPEPTSAPVTSSYGYDDYGGYAGTSTAGVSDEPTGSPSTSSSKNTAANTSTSTKAAPPKRKDTPSETATTSASSKEDTGKKNQPITLSDSDKKGNKGKKDKKDKDCAC